LKQIWCYDQLLYILVSDGTCKSGMRIPASKRRRLF